LSVLCGSENRQQPLLYTSLSGWFCVWWKLFTVRYGLIAYIKQVFITVVESVYSAVRTDCLYKEGFYIGGGKCLQCGTD
jgi:hypothetical protein